MNEEGKFSDRSPFASSLLIPSAAGRFQILALDGGGYKGMFSAAVLAAIEEDLSTRVADHFDLITGTSTGGIIALGLGAGLRPIEIVEFYARRGPEIFADSGWQKVRRLFTPKYDPRKLSSALSGVFGEKTLGDSYKRLVIPAYNLRSDEVYIFKTPHHERLRRDWRERMTDVGTSTAAAPTYFPAHSHRGLRLVDGGVWANNPVMVGIAEAVSVCGANLESLRVFSLGTTTDLRQRSERLDSGGIIQWATSAVDVVMRGQSVGANNTARHLLGDDHILRLDPMVPAGLLGLDRVQTDELLGRARAASRQLMPMFEQRFCKHGAPQFAPLYPTRQEVAQ